MKRLLRVLLVVILVFSMIPSALAAKVGFTHPEIGELIVLDFNQDMPYFDIYGFTQYMVMDSETAYRGMKANRTDLINRDMVGFSDSLSLLFESLEGKSSQPVPLVFEYEGSLRDYSFELSDLPVKERIEAIRLLGGFEGAEGYSRLNNIAGFETVDTSSLEAGHMDYTVDVNGKSYPYRVLMFYFEEDDWEQIYYERYCYFQVGREWKLGRITKEYYSDYRQRVQYIHGMAGTKPDTLQDALSEVLRASSWHMTPSEIEAREGAMSADNSIIVKDTSLFRIPASVTFNFTKDWLSDIEYTLMNSQSYYSAFVSLYIRFYDPVTINSNKDMTWSLPDSLITLKYDDTAPTITITPRQEEQNTSVGWLTVSVAFS